MAETIKLRGEAIKTPWTWGDENDTPHSHPLPKEVHPQREIIEVPATGMEVFSCKPLEKNHFYQITISGFLSCHPRWFDICCTEVRTFDACYASDYQGNFILPLDSERDPHLVITGVLPLRPTRPNGDRSTHIYSSIIKLETTRRLGARIEQNQHRLNESPGLTIHLIRRGDLTEAWQKKEERELQQQRETKLFQLQIDVEGSPRYADLEFIKDFALVYGEKVRARVEEIQKDFRDFWTEDPEFARMLKEQYPRLYTYRTREAIALEEAERLRVGAYRLMLEERVAQKKKPKERPRRNPLTHEEVRKKLLWPIEVDIKDEEALFQKLEKLGIDDPDEQSHYLKQFRLLKAERKERKGGRNAKPRNIF